MSELIDMAFDEGRSAMQSSVDHLKSELTKVRTGKASASLVKDIMVDYYGTPTPLAQVCLLYTSPSPRDRTRSRMPSSA